MRKKVYGRKFSRDYGSRRALFRSLEKAFIEHGRIVTTYIKTKAVQGEIDSLVKLALKKDLNSVKKLVSILGNDKKAASQLVKSAESFSKDRVSGFTRIVKLPKRLGDRAQMARMEWVDKVEEIKTKEVSDKSKTKKQNTINTAGPKKAGLREKLSALTKNPRKSAKKSA